MELDRVVTESVTAEELERAKKYLVGTYEIGLQSNASQSSDITFNERYGLGHEFFQSYAKRIFQITAEDVLRVARKYIRMDRYTMTLVRPKPVAGNP